MDGILTGRGADILLVDDPTKANDASSRLALESTNEWFRNTALVGTKIFFKYFHI